MPKRLLLATKNPGKIKEITSFFQDLPLEIITLQTLSNFPPPVEDGKSYLENAARKAAHYNRLTQIMTLADDSGLAADALNGQPGLMSARFAGENVTDQEKTTKLLKKLEGIPEGKRTAHFFCALSIYDGGNEVFSAETACDGQIATAPRGTQGFGFDPIFFLPEVGKTFAEMKTDEKNRFSHRAKALRLTKDWLTRYLKK